MTHHETMIFWALFAIGFILFILACIVWSCLHAKKEPVNEKLLEYIKSNPIQCQGDCLRCKYVERCFEN